jgi:ATP-binding cassette subfamily F protein uup
MAAAAPAATAAPAAAPVKRKLSYKDARELEALPGRIEALEAQVAQMTDQMNDPAFYRRDSAAINAHNAGLAQAQADLDAAYARWAELDG